MFRSVSFRIYNLVRRSSKQSALLESGILGVFEEREPTLMVDTFSVSRLFVQNPNYI